MRDYPIFHLDTN